MLLLEVSVQPGLGHLLVTQPAPDSLGVFSESVALAIKTVHLVQVVLHQSALFIKLPTDLAFNFGIIGMDVSDVRLEFLHGDLAVGALLPDVDMNILVMCESVAPLFELFITYRAMELSASFVYHGGDIGRDTRRFHPAASSHCGISGRIPC